MAGKYFSIHHRFLAWVGRLTNTIILLPHPVAIGNASEDYYFGLLAARKQGKKLVVLFPFQMPGRFKIRMFDPAILLLESDLLAMKYRGVMSSLLSGIFTLYFIMARIFTMCLYKLFRIESSGYYWRPLAGQDILWRPSATQTKFDWDLVRAQGWEDQFTIPLKLSLNGKIVAFCEEERERIGLPRDAWFVCLHVREGGYSGDWENIRNASISNYLGAIKEITMRGGWVVRMGDSTMTKLPTLDRVIDYAIHPARSAIMDVYLLKECSFYVGTSSGILDTAFLLWKPVVITNATQWINSLPLRRGDFEIFKHVYSRTEKQFISIREWLMRASCITREHWSSPDWIHVENSEDEITNVVKERLDFSDAQATTDLQREFRKEYWRAVNEMTKTFRFDSNDVENCNDWFRMASRMLTWRGEVSAEFLEKNWLKSSRN
ncbi:MAG: TIGR04372 family glycosyltransferase [Chloroflexi bacterium]|nr:TIGR04372 family glycosyltransferase [Chloroflexota bacterium]